MGRSADVQHRRGRRAAVSPASCRAKSCSAGYEAVSGRRISPTSLHFYEVLCAYKSTVATLGSSVRAAATHHSHQDVLLSWLASCGYVFVSRLCELIEEGPQS